MKKKLYYVEVCQKDYLEEYILQSDWFDTKKQALKFAKKITYLEDIYLMRIMSAEWEENEMVGDIIVEEYL